jgi:peptidoglycan/xylan/chitin deacetylase (PgdA/CDA1 family)
MRRAEPKKPLTRTIETLALALSFAGVTAVFCLAQACSRPVYLTFDTGHMGVAEHVAAVLRRQGVVATFFLADEPTAPLAAGGSSLDERWAPWWRARADEGHAFGSHTWDHLVHVADLPDGRMRFRHSLRGRPAGEVVLDAAGYCAQIRKSALRFEQMTGRPMLPIFRAPAGRTSPALLAAARACGYAHVGWPKSGFLGDELDSSRHPNPALLERALRDIREGDILLAHLGIWSRRDPWAPAVLEPLIVGLKARGLCFARLDAHPEYPHFATVQHLRGY